ncbi:MAG: Stk1 family PASTA domain-containing Ser/Thr kinase [Coriobacteriia bacterium]|nr:Stk1 family PASTA domain-containing Ser/Thr kinase [Coriobacteriia bacterium]
MIDRVFGNRYRVVEKLGIGGMAEVYKAIDEVLGRTVAIKVMLPQYASDTTFAARFKQEAQSAANLQSPYIVNIYDWGYESSDSIYFIVMEYVRGTDLKTAIQQRGAINQRKAAEIGSQVCAALSVAHGYDIIHRDIKPHNIMVQPDGNAKVMDFGIARASGSSMTQTGSVLGTAYYVSPEQAQGKQLTPATDLYSLGIVLYETTTGRLPFEAPDAVSVALKQVNELPVPPSTYNPELDPELESIILRAMAKDPLDRYSTAEQMRTALNNYLAGRPIDTDVERPAEKTRIMGAATALPVIGRDGAQPPNRTAVMPSVMGQQQQALNIHSTSRAREEEQRRKRRTTIIIGTIIGLVVVIAAIVGLFSLLNRDDGKVEVPSLIGVTEDEAREQLELLELKAGVTQYENNETVEKGRVISTDPEKKTRVDKGSAIILVVSSGPKAPNIVSVPDLRNKTPENAENELEALGLKARRGDEKFDPEVNPGRICDQDVAAGEEVEEGTTVTFYVSKGKDTVQVPNVIGADWGKAQDDIERAGFTVEYAESQYSKYEEDIVMDQAPRGGGVAERGSTITLTVSLGPEPVALPDLTGKSENEVRLALLDLDFVPLFEKEETALTAQLDRVIWQDPGAGTMLTPKSTVTVYMGIAPPSPPDP